MKFENLISSIDELGDEEINELENFISVMASKFKCPEMKITIENILSLGDDEGQTPQNKHRKAWKKFICNKVPDGEALKIITKLFDKFPDESINKLFSLYAPLKWFCLFMRIGDEALFVK